MQKPSADFFDRSVHRVARDLIGCTLLYDGCGGIIVETESYSEDDPACHAFNGRTPRNAGLFGRPGTAYVYLSYGIHRLLNFVAEPEGSAAAVLIRALEPTTGIEQMRRRRPGRSDLELCSGPGKLSEALGIELRDNGSDLLKVPFEIQLPEQGSAAPEILALPRVGITRAVEYPWRYCAVNSRFVSRPRPPVSLGA